MNQERIRNALGSSRVVPIQQQNSQGPLDLLRLAVEVKRLQDTEKAEQANAVRHLISSILGQLGIKPGDKLLVRRGDETKELNLDPFFDTQQ